MGLARFSLREVLSRPLRVFLTCLSITIGVGAVEAVLLATATTRQAQRDVLKTVSGKADLEIVADGAGFPYRLVKQVSSHDGVKSAVPGLSRFAVLFTQSNRRVRTQVLGIDPRVDQQVRDYRLADGQLPDHISEAMLDKSFAKSIGVLVGDKIKLLSNSGTQSYSVVGLVEPVGGASVALSSAVYLVLPAAQKAFQTGNKIDQIQITVDQPSDVAEVRQQLAETLPEGVTIRESRSTSNLAQETMLAPQNGLYMAIAFAVIIAMFIIYNTFQMAVGERRKQLGILRALGATPKQIEWMVLREALWISLAGCLAGCLLGLYGAGWLNQATAAILQVQLPSVAGDKWPMVVAIGVGLGVSLLGALVPARSAAKVQPIEAIGSSSISQDHDLQRFLTPLGILALPMGLLLIWLSTRGWAVGIDVVGVVLILLGWVLLIPGFLTPACQQLSTWLQPWFGAAAFLAQKQLARHTSRTSLTVGVLFIALATSIGMAGNVLDNVQNVRSWYSRTIVGDFFVRASLPDFSTGAAATLPEDVESKVLQLPGIERIVGIRLTSVQSGQESLMLVSRRFDGQPQEFFDLTEGTLQQAWEGLNRGQVVVGSVLALRRKLAAGQSFSIQTQQGPVDLEIAAIANDYLGGGLTVYMDSRLAKELLGVEGIDSLIVDAAPGQLAAVEFSLQHLCESSGLILQSYSQLVKLIDGMVDSVVASLWMLLALGCAIAAMGLVNTLTMNILEQTREIGVLRVVAMTRSQVRSMMVAQAIMLGLLGLVPGALFGVFVQYSVGLSSYVVLGHEVAFILRPALFFGALLVGLLLVIAASWIPAERAARLKLAAALHYE